MTIASPPRTPPPLRWSPNGRPSGRAALVVVLCLAAGCLAPASAAPSPSRGASARAGAGADRAAVEAARRFLCPQGGAPMRGRCRSGGATAAAGRDLSVRDWDAGLPAAARRQAPCPEGTTAARPLFWTDAVRCLPR